MLAAPLLFALVACRGPMAPVSPELPVAAVHNVPETFFGTEVDDPYRWLEDVESPEAGGWMRAHSEHAHATLARISGRDALRQRLDELDASVPAWVSQVVRVKGDVWFYQRRADGDDQLKLYVRHGLDGEERLVFDPQVLAARTGTPHAINHFSPSPDGRLVAVGVSAGGTEEAALRVLEVDTGRQLGPEIPRVRFGLVSWAPDGEELYFNRLQELAPDQPATEGNAHSAVVAMPPGGDEDAIRVVLRAGHDLGIPAAKFPAVFVQPDGRVIAAAFDGVSPVASVWHATLQDLRAGEPDWRVLATREDRVSRVGLRGDHVYALTFLDAPRYRILEGPIEGFSVRSARELVAEGEGVLTGMELAADALYVSRRDGNARRLVRVPFDEGEAEEVSLPALGTFTLSARPELPGAVLELQSWTRSPRVYAVSPEGAVSDTALQPAFGDLDDLVSTEVRVPSHDGVAVPMSILHRRDVVLDGSNPTLLVGYAAYGVTIEPTFRLHDLPWLEAGGVVAFANPRGSGVFGRDWHEAGKGVTKPNSWRDFIACAEHLVAEGWTRPDRLGIHGGSAGGILVGRAMTERPDLFAAVVASVPVMDMVRRELGRGGAPNIHEYGTRTEEAGFQALLEMSTYHQVRDGTSYPAVLFLHGLNDTRVEVWHSAKAAARLLAATTSEQPILLRLDEDAGHGVGSTRSQRLDERADLLSFLLWQMGVEGWELQP